MTSPPANPAATSHLVPGLLALGIAVTAAVVAFDWRFRFIGSISRMGVSRGLPRRRVLSVAMRRAEIRLRRAYKTPSALPEAGVSSPP